MGENSIGLLFTPSLRIWKTSVRRISNAAPCLRSRRHRFQSFAKTKARPARYSRRICLTHGSTPGASSPHSNTERSGSGRVDPVTHQEIPLRPDILALFPQDGRVSESLRRQSSLDTACFSSIAAVSAWRARGPRPLRMPRTRCAIGARLIVQGSATTGKPVTGSATDLPASAQETESAAEPHKQSPSHSNHEQNP
jgi:hypothetical protein